MSKKILIKWPAAIPCLPLVLIVILSALPALVSYAFDTSFTLTALISIPVLFLIFKSTKNFKRDIVITLAGLTSALFATSTSGSHISIQKPDSRSYILIQGFIENVHYFNESLTWEDPPAGKVSLKLTRIKIDNSWVECSGNIQLIDRENHYEYGDLISAEGALFKYSFPEEDKLFSYELYLKYKKTDYWMRVDKLHNTEPAKGYKRLLKYLYEIRDSIITRASEGLKSENDQKLLASMFFGYKGLLLPDEKEVFKRSGTIHLFAVSGLHIGIAAFFTLSILKLLRFSLKTQTFILVSCLFIYVLMTGSPPSAVRAFVMISVWSVARGYMLPSNGLNNISFAAFLLILANPLNLLSAGFYYTFIITAFLVITYTRTLDIFQNLTEKNSWLGRSGWSSNRALKIYQLVTCSLMASLASFGLNILINEQVIPFAVLTNVFASTLAWFSFVIAILSLSGIQLFYHFQELTLGAIRFIAGEGEFSWNSTSSIWLIVTFYFLLFLIPFGSKKRDFYVLAGALLLLIPILGWPLQKNTVEIDIPPSSNIASVKIEHEGRTYLINCSSKKVINDLFHEDIDVLILPDIRADHIRFLGDALNNCDIKEIIIFREPTAYLKRLISETGKAHLFKNYKNHQIIKTLKVKSDYYELVLSDSAPAGSRLNITLSCELLGKTHLITEVINADKSGLFKEFNFFYSNTGYRESFSF